jgi:hypothetical protein
MFATSQIQTALRSVWYWVGGSATSTGGLTEQLATTATGAAAGGYCSIAIAAAEGYCSIAADRHCHQQTQLVGWHTRVLALATHMLLSPAMQQLLMLLHHCYSPCHHQALAACPPKQEPYGCRTASAVDQLMLQQHPRRPPQVGQIS